MILVSEWWFNNVGQNMLKGINEDAPQAPGGSPCTNGQLAGENPPRLDDETIATFFNSIPEARASYLRLRSTLLPEEQARLEALYHHALATNLDNVETADAFQNTMNKQGIRTVGFRGGTRIGGNV